MRAIVQTLSAVALGVSSLTLGNAALADAFSITYSQGYYGDPAYSVHYGYAPHYYAPHRRLPRHVHHYHHYDGPRKHDKHQHDHGRYGPPGHRGHVGSEHGGPHSYGDGEHGGYRGDGAGGPGSHAKRAHTAYARP